jgi:hypothetical protein
MTAGGTLRLPRRGWGRDGPDYERRAEIASSHGKVPDGKQLVVSHVTADELQISLVDGPSRRAAASVAVPEKVGRLHPVVRAFRDDKSRHEVRRETLPRTLRVVHALISEAERRGMEVAESLPGGRRHYPIWSGPRDGHFTFTCDESTVALRVTEVGLGSRANWEQQTSSWAYRQDNPRATISDYEARGTGQLKVEIVSYNRGPSRQAKWTDGRRGSVDERLGEILHEIELRASDRRQRQEAAIAEHQRELAAWKAAVDSAEERARDAMRAEALDDQVRRWAAATQIRAYCAAMEQRHGNEPETASWVSWASRYADAIDPASVPPRAPVLPEHVPASQLRPFLGGYEPHRPPEMLFID